MNLGRRGFLAALAGAFVADPERLLWVPGKKLFSVPKVRVYPTIEAQLDYIRRNPLYGLKYYNVVSDNYQWLGLSRSISNIPVRAPINA